MIWSHYSIRVSLQSLFSSKKNSRVSAWSSFHTSTNLISTYITTGSSYFLCVIMLYYHVHLISWQWLRFVWSCNISPVYLSSSQHVDCFKYLVSFLSYHVMYVTRINYIITLKILLRYNTHYIPYLPPLIIHTHFSKFNKRF